MANPAVPKAAKSTTPKLTAPQTAKRKEDETEKAALIYEYTVVSAHSLWEACMVAKVARGNPRGVLTDSEQDLLRAMMVMAASGLDSALKQLVRDCIGKLIRKSAGVHDTFEKFVLGKIRIDDGGSTAINSKFLANILVAPDMHSKLIDSFIYELTGDSLQSAEQILKIGAAFLLEPKTIAPDIKKLKEAFSVRNQIIHELDMNLESPIRKRRVRGQDDLKNATLLLLTTCRVFIESVDQKIGT